MKISRGQASLIADLQARLVDKLGIQIGYSHPQVTIIPDHADFIICESETVDDDEIQLVHRNDLRAEWLDEQTIRVFPGDDLKSDHLAEEFVTKLNDWLLDGTLWFDPSVTRVIDGIKITVTKKYGTEAQPEPVYDTNLKSSNVVGTLYRYGQIAVAAKVDKRFQALKKVIDEEWPQDGLEFARRLQAAAPSKSPSRPPKKNSVRGFARKAARYLINRIRSKFQ